MVFRNVSLQMAQVIRNGTKSTELSLSDSHLAQADQCGEHAACRVKDEPTRFGRTAGVRG